MDGQSEVTGGAARPNSHLYVPRDPNHLGCGTGGVGRRGAAANPRFGPFLRRLGRGGYCAAPTLMERLTVNPLVAAGGRRGPPRPAHSLDPSADLTHPLDPSA